MGLSYNTDKIIKRFSIESVNFWLFLLNTLFANTPWFLVSGSVTLGIHQLCKNLKYCSFTLISLKPFPSVNDPNCLAYTGDNVHLDKRSGSLFSTPSMCLAFNSHSFIAQMKQISLIHACKNLLRVLPELIT